MKDSKHHIYTRHTLDIQRKENSRKGYLIIHICIMFYIGPSVVTVNQKPAGVWSPKSCLFTVMNGEETVHESIDMQGRGRMTKRKEQKQALTTNYGKKQ